MDIQTKDGILLRGIPDGTPDDVIKARIEKIRADSAPKAIHETSITDRFIQGMKDPVDAGAQLLTHMLPDSVVNAGNKLNNFIADKTGLVANIPSGGVDQLLKDQAANYKAPQGADFARMGGNMLSPVNLAVASKIPMVGSIGSRMLSGGLGGAGMGLISTPVDGKNFVDEKLKQAAGGAIGGALLPAVTGSIARVISPKASINPQLQVLKNEGVTPTVGQTLGGAWNKAEEKLQSLPIMGDMITRARNAANSQFESAAFNKALSPIGQKLPSGLNGRDALVHTESTLKDAYSNVLNNIGAIKPDNTFNSNVSNIKSMVDKLLIPKADKNKFAQALSDVNASIDNNGYMTSDAYKGIESTLGQDAQKLGLGNYSEAKIGTAVKQLQAELKDMLSRQAGSHADDLKAVNTGWANFKRVQNASSKLGAENGEFTPAQFQNAVRALDKSKDKAAFARGSALGQNLGDAGKSVLTGKVADSGTAGRYMLGLGAVGAGTLNPAIPAGLMAGGALYTQPAQKFLNSILSSRPQSSAQLSELLRKGNNYMLPAASAIGAGLLN